jgi:NAD(P)-dependent dehydrogenase (short-subunit alcohol dehydrogenase family)
VDTDMIRRTNKTRPDPEAAWQKMIDYAPLKRITTPDEIAAGILYLASDDARFITGVALPIDGGTTAGH